MSFFEINKKRVKTFQRIIHHRIRKFSHNNKTFRNERKSFENQRNILEYFFHPFSRFLL